MAALADLFKALGELAEDGPAQATSLRLPKALHEALSIATELGMDVSASAATREALTDRVRDFARQAAFTAHFNAFPDDLPHSVLWPSGVCRAPTIPLPLVRSSSRRSLLRSSDASPIGP